MAGRDGEVGETNGAREGKKVEKKEVGHIDPISAVAVIDTWVTWTCVQVCGAVYEDETSLGSSCLQVTPADYCKTLNSIFFFSPNFIFFHFHFLQFLFFFSFWTFWHCFFISFRPQMTESQDSILPHAQKSLENCLVPNLGVTDEGFLGRLLGRTQLRRVCIVWEWGKNVCKVMYDWSHALSCSPKNRLSVK